jgi:hypothetical protein
VSAEKRGNFGFAEKHDFFDLPTFLSPFVGRIFLFICAVLLVFCFYSSLCSGKPKLWEIGSLLVSIPTRTS